MTLTVQLAPAETDPPQVFVCSKSPAFVPEIVILVAFGEEVVFESDTVELPLAHPIAVLENVSELAENVTTPLGLDGPLPQPTVTRSASSMANGQKYLAYIAASLHLPDSCLLKFMAGLAGVALRSL